MRAYYNAFILALTPKVILLSVALTAPTSIAVLYAHGDMNGPLSMLLGLVSQLSWMTLLGVGKLLRSRNQFAAGIKPSGIIALMIAAACLWAVFVALGMQWYWATLLTAISGAGWCVAAKQLVQGDHEYVHAIRDDQEIQDALQRIIELRGTPDEPIITNEMLRAASDQTNRRMLELDATLRARYGSPVGTAAAQLRAEAMNEALRIHDEQLGDVYDALPGQLEELRQRHNRMWDDLRLRRGAVADEAIAEHRLTDANYRVTEVPASMRLGVAEQLAQARIAAPTDIADLDRRMASLQLMTSGLLGVDDPSSQAQQLAGMRQTALRESLRRQMAAAGMPVQSDQEMDALITLADQLQALGLQPNSVVRFMEQQRELQRGDALLMESSAGDLLPGAVQISPAPTPQAPGRVIVSVLDDAPPPPAPLAITETAREADRLRDEHTTQIANARASGLTGAESWASIYREHTAQWADLRRRSGQWAAQIVRDRQIGISQYRAVATAAAQTQPQTQPRTQSRPALFASLNQLAAEVSAAKQQRTEPERERERVIDLDGERHADA